MTERAMFMAKLSVQCNLSRISSLREITMFQSFAISGKLFTHSSRQTIKRKHKIQAKICRDEKLLPGSVCSILTINY